MKLSKQGQESLTRLNDELEHAGISKGMIIVINGMVKGIVDTEQIELLHKVNKNLQKNKPEINRATLESYTTQILQTTSNTGYHGLTVSQVREEIMDVIRGAVSLGIEQGLRIAKKQQEERERYERENPRL